MEESPIFQDIPLYSTVMKFENNEENFLPFNLTDFDDMIPLDFDQLFSPFDLYYEDEETTSTDQDPNTSQITPDLSSNCIDMQEYHIVPNNSPLIEMEQSSNISLSFINPPEPFYHVRYLSEITSEPVNGNIVNTRMNNRRHVSGRYLKGVHGRYITVALPSIFSNHSNLFIRVTRLTVPYQDTSFIHPYPLFYSYPKKNAQHSHVLMQDSSIYFKINKDELCSQSKCFPHLILTRLKQHDLKDVNNLYSFDNSGISYPFHGKNSKKKIAIYQLKKSQLDFRLVIRYEKTGEFINTNLFCRSSELLEEEGIELKKSST